MYNYNAKVKRVVDGDTIDLEVDLGFSIKFTERFRLLGIDTPEIFGVAKDSEEYLAGMRAKERVLQLIPEGSMVEIWTHKDRKDKYGRYLVEIFTPDGMLRINDVLVAEGLATKY